MPRKKTSPPKVKKRRKSPRGVVVTVHHPEGASPVVGSTERGQALRYRAMQLKIRGHSLSEIALKLFSEFELKEPPGRSTVQFWVDDAFAEGAAGMKAQAEQYVQTVMARSEAMIKTLMPYALDEFVVERTAVVDGERVKVISEEVFDERVKAIAEIRKQGETVMKALGITRPQADGGAGISSEGTKMFVIQTINQNIAKTGEIISQDRAQTVLELTTGDAVIDGL